MIEQWLRDHWPEGLVLATMAVLRWFGLREVARVDKALDDHEERIHTIEIQHVTREDFDELRQSLTATIVHASDRVETQVRELRGIMLDRR